MNLRTLAEMVGPHGGSIQTGPFGSQLHQSDYTDDGVPVVMPKDIEGGRIDQSSVARIPQHKADALARHKLSVGDIVFPRRGEIRKCALVTQAEDGFLCGTGCLKISVPRNVLSPRFLHYYLHLPGTGGWLEQHAVGTTMLNLNTSILGALPVPEVALSSQCRIANILSAYDDLIENNRRRIKLLEEAARLIYREWFVRLRFPGHEHTKVVDGVPMGWRKVRLHEVCVRITDGSHSSPTSVPDGFPMASVKDMHDWGFNVSGCRRVSHQDFEMLVRNDCKPLKNDVLIAKDGSYLKHTFVVQEEMDLVLLSSVAILRPSSLINSHLLNFILRDPQTKSRMAGYVSGVALPRIILNEFRNFEILLPPGDVQDRWAVRGGAVAGQCHNLVKQNDRLAKARDLLLPRLMSGEVEV